MVKCALLVMLVTASTVVASAETVPQGPRFIAGSPKPSAPESAYKVIASPPR